MANPSASGFARAPVSFCLTSAVGASSVAASMLVPASKRVAFALSSAQLAQAWRLASSHFVFSSPGELVVGLILLYNFRQFERTFGSKKFASALVFYMLVGSALQLLLLLTVPALKTTAPGPYAVIFALFVHFRFDVPAASRIRVLLVSVTDKIFMYLLGAQLLFAAYPYSLLTGCTGLAAGLVFRSSRTVQQWCRPPDALTRVLSRCFGALVSLITPASAGASVGAGAGAGAVAVAGDRGAAARADGYAPVDSVEAAHVPAHPRAAATSVAAAASAGSHSSERLIGGAPNDFVQALMAGMNAAPVDPAAVAQLVALGFSESQVRRALALSGGNIDLAASVLLEGR